MDFLWDTVFPLKPRFWWGQRDRGEVATKYGDLVCVGRRLIPVLFATGYTVPDAMVLTGVQGGVGVLVC